MEEFKTNPEIIQPRKFGLKERLYWGSASFGGAIINGIYSSMLNIFYTTYLGLSREAPVIVFIAIIYGIVNAINDPLVGIISDQTRAKNGRRIPFMRYTAPFLALTFVLIWFSPSIDQANIWIIFIWMIITTCLYDTAYTTIFLVYSALLPEITEDEKERNNLQVFASFFSLIGMILGFFIPELFRNESRILLWISMVAVGIIGASLIILTTYKFKERPEFTDLDEPLGFVDSIKHTFKSKSFRVLVSANFMSIYMQSTITGSVFYLADYIVQMSSIILLVFVFLPLLIGIWLTPKFIDKFGVVKSNQILLIIGGIGLVLTTFMFNSILIFICLAIAGFGFVGPLIFTNVMYAQVADEDELKTGVRREGAFFGINAMITKPAQSLALIVPALLLWIMGYIPHDLGTPPNLNQPEGVFISIRIFFGLIPGILLLIGAFILRYYPLKGQYLEKVKAEVLELHQEKKSKLNRSGN